ncbi:hypothetical protein NLZ42_15650 [Escherichia coli]|nr:hypothetical protein [Escherichia coli]
MTILNKDWPVEFPFPTVIRTVVCSDLDETYIPSDSDKKKLSGIVQLESYITSHAEKKGILAGWITGTNLDSAWRKSRGYISRSPHFICKRKLTAVCSHQTRIGNLDAHLTQTDI